MLFCSEFWHPEAVWSVPTMMKRMTTMTPTRTPAPDRDLDPAPDLVQESPTADDLDLELRTLLRPEPEAEEYWWRAKNTDGEVPLERLDDLRDVIAGIDGGIRPWITAEGRTTDRCVQALGDGELFSIECRNREFTMRIIARRSGGKAERIRLSGGAGKVAPWMLADEAFSLDEAFGVLLEFLQRGRLDLSAFALRPIRFHWARL